MSLGHIYQNKFNKTIIKENNYKNKITVLTKEIKRVIISNNSIEYK